MFSQVRHTVIDLYIYIYIIDVLASFKLPVVQTFRFSELVPTVVRLLVAGLKLKTLLIAGNQPWTDGF